MTLRQLSINHWHRDTRTRAAGPLMLGSRIEPKVIAEQLGLSRQSVYNWSHAWRDSGVCGLICGHSGGRSPALSDVMATTALDVARTESLTLAQIGHRLQAVHGEPLPCQIETLGELQCAARDGRCRLFYFDEAGLRAAPRVQRGWSPRGLPHSPELNSHCKRSLLRELDFSKDNFIYAVSARTVKRTDVVDFLDSLFRKGDGCPTVIALDNVSIHHSIDQNTLDRWFLEHRALLFHLSLHSQLNLIEIVWTHFGYHWRRFLTWTKETIDAKLVEPLGGYGTRFQVNFS